MTNGLITRATATTLVIATALLCSGAANGSAARAECSLAPEEATYILRHIVVYEQTNNEQRKYFAACWRPSGITRRIFSEPITSAPPPYLSAVAAAGPWLVVKRTSPSGNADPSSDTLLSFNVVTGRHGPQVSSGSPHTVGPLPDTNGERRLLSPLAIARDGHYAWIMSGFPLPASQALGDAIYTTDGHGGDRVIDEGAVGSLGHLTIDGQTIRWRHGGHARSSRLP